LFGSLALRAVRDEMVRSSLARTTINARVNRIRRVFRWATSLEMIPVAVVEGLATVAGLQRGRTSAPEPASVRPVPIEDVERPCHTSRRPSRQWSTSSSRWAAGPARS
jgi:hypothetical protein